MKSNSSLNKILLYIAIFLFLFITVSGVAVTISQKKGQKNSSLPHFSTTNPEIYSSASKSKNQQELSSFTGIGRMRLVTANRGTTIILTPWFSYTAGDTEFLEELSKKAPLLKTVIADWFSVHTESQLKSMGETTIKEELLNAINENLVLSKVQGIFFSEFLYL